jgi:hypothetical protein
MKPRTDEDSNNRRALKQEMEADSTYRWITSLSNLSFQTTNPIASKIMWKRDKVKRLLLLMKKKEQVASFEFLLHFYSTITRPAIHGWITQM